MNERNLEDHHLIILVIKAYDYCMGFRPARGGAYRKRFGVISCVSVVVFSFEKSEEKNLENQIRKLADQKWSLLHLAVASPLMSIWLKRG